MNVGEVCNRDVVIIRGDKSVLDAAKIMREYHVGDVVVVEDRDNTTIPVGILTDRDVVVEVLAQEVALDAVSVRDAMSRELLKVHEEAGIMETVKRMREKGVRRVPVVNNQEGLEGIFSVDDVIELLCEQMADLVGLIKAEQKYERGRCV